VLAFNPNVQPLTGSTIVKVKFNQMNNTVLLFGSFSTVGNQTHSNLAEVIPSTGVPTSWSPSTSGQQINTALVEPTNGVVYVGGAFLTANSSARNNVAAFDSSGQLTSTQINTFGDVRTLQASRAFQWNENARFSRHVHFGEQSRQPSFHSGARPIAGPMASRGGFSPSSRHSKRKANP
jgi:hypothetical protein